MIEMNNWATQAVSKLNEGRNEIPVFNADDVSKKLRDSKLTQKQKDEVMAQARASIVADSAHEALCNFCRQSEVFAQKVVEGGSFADCVRSVMGINVYAMSDLDVYKKCAAYYFPAATIGMSITINEAFPVREEKEPAASSSVLNLKLDDFLL